MDNISMMKIIPMLPTPAPMPEEKPTTSPIGGGGVTDSLPGTLPIKNAKITKASIKKETARISVDTVLAKKGKRQLTGFHAKEFRYAGDDKRVAVVSAKGKIKAVGKGKCSVCVYARNGYENPCKWCGNAIYRGFGISYIKN